MEYWVFARKVSIGLGCGMEFCLDKLTKCPGKHQSLDMAYSVAILDRQYFFEEGIKDLLKRIDPSISVSHLETSAVQNSLTLPPNIDLLILDPAAIESGVSSILSKIQRTERRITVLVVASHFDLTTASTCLQFGVSGYVLKSDPLPELELAVRKVLNGSVYFCQEIQEHQVRTLHLHLAGGSQLTHREREIMHFLLQDMSPKEIAVHMDISRKTVDAHKRNVFQKLGIRSMTQLVLYGVRAGLVRS